jgi:hypothetical protein
MYKKINEFEGVSEFTAYDEIIAYKDSNKSRKNRTLNILKGSDKIEIAKSVTGFQLNKTDLYYSNWNNRTFKYSLENDSVKELNYNQVGVYKINETILFAANKKIYFQSNKYPEISVKVFGNKKIITDDYIFSTNNPNTQINSYSFKNNINLEWKFSFEEFGVTKSFLNEEVNIEFSNLIGVWNEQLIVQLNTGKLLSLNYRNGNILWEKTDIDENRTKQEIGYSINPYYKGFLNGRNGELYFFQGQLFMSMDLKSKKTTALWHSKDENSDHSLFIRQADFRENYIYFTAGIYPNIGTCNTVGIFDIQANQTVWKHNFAFDQKKFLTNNMQVNNKMFLILDSINCLHIFGEE